MPDENLEQEARTLGWVPQDEFKGDPERWVDADTFVERGHQVMPLLKKNNQRLEADIRATREENARLKAQVDSFQESVTELQKVHEEATKEAVKRAREQASAEIKAAKEAGDVDAEIAAAERLADLRAEEVAAARAPEKVNGAPAAEGERPPDPDFKAWAAENQWFGKDDRKTLRAMGIAQELRADPEYDKLTGRAFYDKVNEIIAERTGGPPSKVGSGRPTGGGGAGNGRSYADLPADAKQACDRQGQKLIGAGRAFKDQTAWREYYTKLYYQGDE